MNAGSSIRVAHARERRKIVDGLLVAVAPRGPGALTEDDVIEAGSSGRSETGRRRRVVSAARVSLLLVALAAGIGAPKRDLRVTASISRRV